MHLQIVDYTLPLVFILVLVFVIAALFRIWREGVVRILVCGVESAKHPLHLLLVYCL